jgi:hypothetical protein
MLLLARQRCQHLDGGLGVPAPAVGRTENEAGMWMSGDAFENFVRLFYCEPGIPLQKSCSVTKSNLKRSNRLRNAVQLNIQWIPAIVMSL